MILRPIAAATALALCLPAAAGANEFAPRLSELATGRIAAILADPDIIAALREQNARTASLPPAEIERLDRRWRAEVGTAETPLIAEVTGTPLAERLRSVREDAGGLFTEIFVMDAVGLNVAASDTTSDYWQGDEAKWQATCGAGSVEAHIGEIEFDESTQTYQSQVSVAIPDPDGDGFLGAATFGVNVALLN